MIDILIVEDNVEIATLLSDFLRKENYIVSAFGYQKPLQPVDFADIFGCLWYTGTAKKNVVF